MVETSVEIRLSPTAGTSLAVETNVAGEAEQQAELVCFAFFAVRIILLLEPSLRTPLVQSLTLLEEASAEHLESLASGNQPEVDDFRARRLALASSDSTASAESQFRATVRLIGARRSPRFDFKMRPRRLARGGGAHHDAAASLHAFLYSLLERRAADGAYLRRLATTAGLIGWAAGHGWIASGNEFDVALAAVDVAWRETSAVDEVAPSADGDPLEGARLECPRCGNHGSLSPRDEAFELRVWPSEAERIRKCADCGAGLWIRGTDARVFAEEVWRTMELLRTELARHPGGRTFGPGLQEPAETAGNGLLADLKRVFTEHRWPFTEVRGAPVLLSELSGPLERWKFFAQVVEEQRLIAFYSVCPLDVPDDRRPEVANLLTRANYALAVGNFELDFDDGEVRFKTVLDVEGQLEPARVKRMVRANGLAMETYLPGIAAVITGMPALPAIERRAGT